MLSFTCPACGHVEKLTVAFGGAAPTPAPQPTPQTTSIPSCPFHGPMTHKAGVGKKGPYSGFFCFAEGCETTPVWDPKR